MKGNIAFPLILLALAAIGCSQLGDLGSSNT
jgi:hypothetical protein